MSAKRTAAKLTGLALAMALVSGVAAQDAPVIVVRAGKVLTLAGPPLSPGAVLIRDGKVAAIGATVDVPEGAQVIDVPDGVVIPGLVAAYTRFAEGTRNSKESVTPELRVADGVDRFREWRDVLAGGVTTVYLSPSGGRLMPGQGAVVKVSDGAPSTRVMSDQAALRVVLGEWSKNPPRLWDPPLPPTPDNPSARPVEQLPTTRMGQLKLLREMFDAAKQPEDADEELRGPRLEALQAVLDGRPVRVVADRAEDIRNALALADAYGLRIIIEGGSEAHVLAEALARRGVPVVLNSRVKPGRLVGDDLTQPHILGDVRIDDAAVLARAGVRLALVTDDASTPDLLTLAAAAVGHGLSEDQALRTITTDAAEILGVADRAGTIQVGRDADLAILSGEPLATRTVVLTTVSDGRIAYQRTADDAADETDAAGPLTILRVGTILTGTGGSITNGEVRILGGKIVSVGERTDTPGAEVVDLGDRVLMPGMIDIQSHLGLHWETNTPTLAPQPSTVGQGSGGAKSVSIAYAVDPTDPAFGNALRAGVTSVALAPPETGLYCGTVAVLKTAGDGIDDMIVEPIAALKFSVLGDRNRKARAAEIRSFLDKTKKYDSDWEQFDHRWAEFERRYAYKPDDDPKEPSRLKRDSEQEILRRLFTEGLPALVVAGRRDEIIVAADVFRREYGLTTVVLNAIDGDRAADELTAAEVGVALGPEIIREQRGTEVNVAAELARLGLPVALQSRGTSGTQFLRVTAAHAVRHGMDAGDALRAITSRPAEMLGLGTRLGSLDPGRDADIVVLSGDPLELTSRIEKVYVNGELAYDAEAAN